MSTTDRIKAECDKLTKLYAELPKNKMSLVEPLIQNAAFMKVTLEDLQEAINENGCSEQYKNGANQYGKKASADVQAYNAMIKNYTNVLDKLDKLLPPEREKSKLEEFMNE